MDLAEAVATMPLGPTVEDRRVEWEVAAAQREAPPLLERDFLRATITAHRYILTGQMPDPDEVELELYHDSVMRALERGEPVPDA